jgi:hypothetical protein
MLTNLRLYSEGLRGTVSTYDLNVNAVTEMLEGKLMPRPLTILSSLISVTYIGAGNFPKTGCDQPSVFGGRL